MNRLLILPILLITLLLGTPASAADWEKGLDAYNKGDYATALREWRPLAEKGNARAQTALGLMYEKGKGVTQDYSLAHMWFNIAASQGVEGAKRYRDEVEKKMTPTQIENAKRLARECVKKKYKGCGKPRKVADDFQKGFDALKKRDVATALREWKLAAEQGDALAQTALGEMYRLGQGVPKDYKTAVKWWKLAAEQGNAPAQFLLGVMYEKGQGVPKDAKTAAKWYRLAVEQGFAPAQYNLGWMYDNGEGVIRDYSLAHMWWNIAASQGDEGAKEHRDRVETEMTSTQIETAQRLARECEKKKYKGCGEEKQKPWWKFW